ncbi:MAG: putative 4-hydroxybenzoate polyprenyltransferase [Bacteroidetes bacterium]|nr:putative 4-hydroxybenzoate polyprenyltransferase [Bacteroidota bacterium]
MAGKNRSSVGNYLSLVKFSHTVFAMPFALIGFFIAVHKSEYEFRWYVFILMLLCMIFARNAAMSFNRYTDRDIDVKNPRTAGREIPSGKIKVSSALIFVIINGALFVATAFFVNRIVFFLSPIALLIILGYSFTKRFTALCHFILGMGLSLAPIGAYLTVTGEFALLPLLFSLTVLFWVSGFDIIYALQDEEFDKTERLHSIPALLGKRHALNLSVAVHALCIVTVIIAGMTAGFGWWYTTGAAIFIVLLIYQHLIVRPDDLSRVDLAFFTTNGIAGVLFSVFSILELYLNK